MLDIWSKTCSTFFTNPRWLVLHPIVIMTLRVGTFAIFRTVRASTYRTDRYDLTYFSYKFDLFLDSQVVSAFHCCPSNRFVSIASPLNIIWISGSPPPKAAIDAASLVLALLDMASWKQIAACVTRGLSVCSNWQLVTISTQSDLDMTS